MKRRRWRPGCCSNPGLLPRPAERLPAGFLREPGITSQHAITGSFHGSSFRQNSFSSEDHRRPRRELADLLVLLRPDLKAPPPERLVSHVLEPGLRTSTTSGSASPGQSSRLKMDQRKMTCDSRLRPHLDYNLIIPTVFPRTCQHHLSVATETAGAGPGSQVRPSSASTSRTNWFDWERLEERSRRKRRRREKEGKEKQENPQTQPALTDWFY